METGTKIVDSQVKETKTVAVKATASEFEGKLDFGDFPPSQMWEIA